MAQFKNIEVIVAHRTDAELKSTSTMEVADLTTGERTIGALTQLGIWWVVAVLCVLIPVLHFFLVPLGVLGGIWAFIRKMGHKQKRADVEVKCPKCQSIVVLKKATFNWPIAETCGSCRSGLTVSPR